MMKKTTLLTTVLFTCLIGFSQVKINTGLQQDINDIATRASYLKAWAVADSGLILSTQTKGADWTVESIGAPNDLNTVTFVSDDLGWIAGDTGTILYTEDGGQNWNYPAGISLAGMNITGIYMSSDDTIWVSTTSGVYVSFDGGKSWGAPESGSGTGNRSAIVNFGSSIIMACYGTSGNSGNINQFRRTVDGGATWANAGWNGGQQNFNSMSIASSTVGYLSTSSNIIKTTNSGGTWNFNTTTLFVTNQDLYCIERLNDTLMIGGNKAWLFRTEDGGNDWNTISTAATTSQISNIKWDPSKKYCFMSYRTGTLYRSSNNGKTWTQIASLSGGCTPNGIVDFEVTDSNTIYVARSSGCNGQPNFDIYVTYNALAGSPTWEKHFSFPGGSPNNNNAPTQMSFSDKTHGWFVAGGFDPNDDNKTYYRTDSVSADTSIWQAILGPHTARIKAVFALDSNTVFLGYSDGRIYRSLDASQATPTWTQLTTATMTGGSQCNGFYYDAATQTLFAYGVRYVMRSTDFANDFETWSQWADLDGTTSSYWDMTSGSSAGEYWVVGQVNRLFHTTDDGLTWELVNPCDVWGTIRNVAAAKGSSQVMYAVGDNGYIIRTADQTSSFTNISDTSTSSNYKSSYAPNDTVLFVVSDSGEVLTTYNAGLSWTKKQPVSTQLNSIFVFENNVWAVGDSGKIIRSTDLGQNWSVVASGTTENLKTVYFYDANTGFAAGENNSILKSTDGGATWASPLDISVFKESIVDLAYTLGNATSSTNYNVFALEENGKIYLSSNSGIDYSILTNIGNNNSAISAGNNNSTSTITDDRVWVAGNDAGTGAPVVKRSKNGGSSWATIPNPAGVNLKKMNDIFIVNNTNVWAVGDSGLIIKYTVADDNNTANVVKTIITSPLIGSHLNINAVRGVYNNTNNITVTADSGYVFKTTNGGTSWSVFSVPAADTFNVYAANDNTAGAVVGEAGLLVYPALAVTLNDPSSLSQCIGGDFTVTYTVTNGPLLSGNKFYLELSDSSGSFLSAVTIDSVTSTTSGTFNNAYIPATSSVGTKYRLRITSSNPVVSSINASDISVNAVPVPNFTWTESSPGVIDFTNTSTGASTYAWDFGNGSGTSTSASPSYNYGVTGIWRALLTASEGSCSDTISKEVSASVNTDDVNMLATVSVYPNPTSSKISISGVSSGQVEIINEVNQPVVLEEITVEPIVIDLSTLPKGVYFVKIISEGKTQVNKIVLQ